MDASTNRDTAHRLLSASAIGLALLLGACSSPDTGFGNLWSPFSSSEGVTTDSLTVRRVRGTSPEVEPLMTEPGNVWPEGESPRAYLNNPDEAMRNIPSYRPELIEGAPPATPPAMPPARRPRGSSTLVPGPIQPQEAPAFQAAPGQPATPPPRRLEGRPMTLPDGRPAVGTGGTDRVQGFTSPQGGGAVVRDGNVETFIGPDGQVRTRVAPQ